MDSVYTHVTNVGTAALNVEQRNIPESCDVIHVEFFFVLGGSETFWPAFWPAFKIDMLLYNETQPWEKIRKSLTRSCNKLIREFGLNLEDMMGFVNLCNTQYEF